MPNPTQLVIDSDALRHNLSVVRALCPGARIMAMVKADGYGHGLITAARAFATADGLAVARLDEALRLRQAGITQRILLLGSWLDTADVFCCATHGIDVVIHDESTAALVLGRRSWPAAFAIWLKLDTGMHRLGLNPAAFAAVDARLRAHPSVREIVHMSHFSSADEPDAASVDEQLRCFRRTCGGLTASISLANSAALISRPETHGDWVRPGIMLYGDNPLKTRHPLDLKPAMTLQARVLAVRDVPAGEAVGYGCSWRCSSHSRIATVGIGYGDGYPRHAASGTPVWIGGRRAPLVGRVSMDSLAVDISACPEVVAGDEVELWGCHIAAAEAARHAGTISYELFTGVNARVPRRLLGCDGDSQALDLPTESR